MRLRAYPLSPLPSPRTTRQGLGVKKGGSVPPACTPSLQGTPPAALVHRGCHQWEHSTLAPADGWGEGGSSSHTEPPALCVGGLARLLDPGATDSGGGPGGSWGLWEAPGEQCPTELGAPLEVVTLVSIGGQGFCLTDGGGMGSTGLMAHQPLSHALGPHQRGEQIGRKSLPQTSLPPPAPTPGQAGQPRAPGWGLRRLHVGDRVAGGVTLGPGTHTTLPTPPLPWGPSGWQDLIPSLGGWVAPLTSPAPWGRGKPSSRVWAPHPHSLSAHSPCPLGVLLSI